MGSSYGKKGSWDPGKITSFVLERKRPHFAWTEAPGAPYYGAEHRKGYRSQEGEECLPYLLLPTPWRSDPSPHTRSFHLQDKPMLWRSPHYWVYYYTLVVPELRGLMQGGCCKVKSSLGYIVRTRLYSKIRSQKQKEKHNNKKERVKIQDWWLWRVPYL